MALDVGLQVAHELQADASSGSAAPWGLLERAWLCDLGFSLSKMPHPTPTPHPRPIKPQTKGQCDLGLSCAHLWRLAIPLTLCSTICGARSGS